MKSVTWIIVGLFIAICVEPRLNYLKAELTSPRPRAMCTSPKGCHLTFKSIRH